MIIRYQFYKKKSSNNRTHKILVSFIAISFNSDKVTSKVYVLIFYTIIFLILVWFYKVGIFNPFSLPKSSMIVPKRLGSMIGKTNKEETNISDGSTHQSFSGFSLFFCIFYESTFWWRLIFPSCLMQSFQATSTKRIYIVKFLERVR